MTYSEIQEILILTNKNRKNQSFLEIEFPYKQSYELMNLAIINAAKNGKKYVDFDFIDSDLSKIKDKTINEIERDIRRIYPSYDSWTNAIKDTFNYPRYLASRGFEIEIRDSLKNHGYASKSYHISWENE
ncbi:hypothetical protein ACS386_13690 [Flavobacteriaceae bacterium LMO-SS05]